MNGLPSERVAIITGGSDGIGRATAELRAAGGAAAGGAAVVIRVRRTDKLAATRAAIATAGPQHRSHRAWCVGRHNPCGNARRRAGSFWAARPGRIDMMVNKAISASHVPIAKLSLHQWRADFAVNAEAAFVGAKAMQMYLPG